MESGVYLFKRQNFYTMRMSECSGISPKFRVESNRRLIICTTDRQRGNGTVKQSRLTLEDSQHNLDQTIL